MSVGGGCDQSLRLLVVRHVKEHLHPILVAGGGCYVAILAMGMLYRIQYTRFFEGEQLFIIIKILSYTLYLWISINIIYIYILLESRIYRQSTDVSTHVYTYCPPIHLTNFPTTQSHTPIILMIISRD